ncbi:MAG: C39 family peptidase [Clostridiales bacterium]|nr:C39 family peptidase [Clostridiales bacterium]
MSRRHKSKTRVLDRIIVVEAIVLVLLIGVYKFTNKPTDQVTGNIESYVTPTPQTLAEVSPTPIPTIEPTIVPSVEEPLEEENFLSPTPENLTTDSDALTPESDTPVIVTEENETAPQDHTAGSEDAVDSSPEEEDTSRDTNIPAFANGMSKEFLASLSDTQEGTLLETPGRDSIIYYMQTDPRWASKYYGGTDTIEKYGCGPTSLSIVISTLTDTKIDPVQMCAWANEKGYWFLQQGSKHQLIPEGGEAFGLKVTGVANDVDAADQLRTALSDGKLVIALMGKGSFTRSGHFIVLRGITEDDMVYVADPNSRENTDKTWKLTQIVNEAKSWAGGNGPFWIMSK